MNLADKITLSRILLSPLFFIFFLVLYYAGSVTIWPLLALWLLFGIIELTDLFDGIAARRMNQVSDLGKIFDPFADVISRITYFFCFLLAGIMPHWIFLIIIYREFSILFIRLVLVMKKVVMGAGMSGKIKAWSYAIGGIGGIFQFSMQKLGWLSGWMNWISRCTYLIFILCACLSIFSLLVYLRFFVKTMRNTQSE